MFREFLPAQMLRFLIFKHTDLAQFNLLTRSSGTWQVNQNWIAFLGAPFFLNRAHPQIVYNRESFTIVIVTKAEAVDVILLLVIIVLSNREGDKSGWQAKLVQTGKVVVNNSCLCLPVFVQCPTQMFLGGTQMHNNGGLDVKVVWMGLHTMVCIKVSVNSVWVKEREFGR